MLDPGMTAGLLEERLMLVERMMPDDRVLPAAIRQAMRHLQDQPGTLFTAEEVRSWVGIIETGAEISCYLERRGYYKPEGCIVYAMRCDDAWIMTSNGEALDLRMEDYNRKWRFWAQYPAGTERYRQAWSDGKDS